MGEKGPTEKCSWGKTHISNFMPLQGRLSVCLCQSAVACAVVFRERFLRHAVERKGGDCAVEARRSHAPSAHRAAPAGKVAAIDPDQTSLHASAFWWIPTDRGLSTCARGTERGNWRNWERLPLAASNLPCARGRCKVTGKVRAGLLLGNLRARSGWAMRRQGCPKVRISSWENHPAPPATTRSSLRGFNALLCGASAANDAEVH